MSGTEQYGITKKKKKECVLERAVPGKKHLHQKERGGSEVGYLSKSLLIT